MIEIYTDGSSRGNPGNAGYGVVVFKNGNLIDAYSKQYENETNNAMEMKAILWAMVNYGKSKEEVIVYSDSSYAVNTFNSWWLGWKKNGWRKSDKKTPENLDLVKAWDELYSAGYRITLQKIKGHKGIYGNELADDLATGIITLKDLKI